MNWINNVKWDASDSCGVPNLTKAKVRFIEIYGLVVTATPWLGSPCM